LILCYDVVITLLFSEQDCASFWKSVKKLNRNRLPLVNSVDNISGEGAIAEVWREHCESILNCADQSKYKNKVTTTFVILNSTVVCMFL